MKPNLAPRCSVTDTDADVRTCRCLPACYITGEKGRNRVRLYPHAASGLLWLDGRGDDGKRRRRSLEHRDWTLGKAQADQLAADRGALVRPVDATQLTLAMLFDIYEREVTPEKGPQSRAHDRRAMRMFRSCWGDRFPVMKLGAIEWGRFIRARRAGGLGGRPVGNRMIEYDLALLSAICNWAVRAKVIPSSPVAGLERPKEPDPRQPMLLPDDYLRLQQVAEAVSPLFALALTLAWETPGASAPPRSGMTGCSPPPPQHNRWDAGPL